MDEVGGLARGFGAPISASLAGGVSTRPGSKSTREEIRNPLYINILARTIDKQLSLQYVLLLQNSGAELMPPLKILEQRTRREVDSELELSRRLLRTSRPTPILRSC